MNVSIRKKYYIFQGLWFVVSMVSGVLLAIYAPSYLPLILLPFFIAGIGQFMLKCPNCKKPISFNPIRLFGKNIIWTITANIPRNCSRCKYDLTIVQHEEEFRSHHKS